MLQIAFQRVCQHSFGYSLELGAVGGDYYTVYVCVNVCVYVCVHVCLCISMCTHFCMVNAWYSTFCFSGTLDILLNTRQHLCTSENLYVC